MEELVVDLFTLFFMGLLCIQSATMGLLPSYIVRHNAVDTQEKEANRNFFLAMAVALSYFILIGILLWSLRNGQPLFIATLVASCALGAAFPWIRKDFYIKVGFRSETSRLGRPHPPHLRPVA